MKQPGLARMDVDGRIRIAGRSTDIIIRGHTVEELIHLFQKASWDESIGVVVRTGAGDEAFRTGGDPPAHDGQSDGRRTIGLPTAALQSPIRDVPKPVVALSAASRSERLARRSTRAMAPTTAGRSDRQGGGAGAPCRVRHLRCDPVRRRHRHDPEDYRVGDLFKRSTAIRAIVRALGRSGARLGVSSTTPE